MDFHHFLRMFEKSGKFDMQVPSICVCTSVIHALPGGAVGRGWRRCRRGHDGAGPRDVPPAPAAQRPCATSDKERMRHAVGAIRGSGVAGVGMMVRVLGTYLQVPQSSDHVLLPTRRECDTPLVP